MDDESTVTSDTPNAAADDTQADDGVSDTDTNDVADDSADESTELQRLKEQNIKLFERAKKAEGFLKDKDGNWVKKVQTTTVVQPAAASESQDVQLTPMDSILLFKANVTEKEDIETVLEYARFKRMSIDEALKSSVIKAELASAAEERKSSQVANSGQGKRSASKVTDDQILQRVNSGTWKPETEDDWKRLNAALDASKGK